jgi:nitrite reductase/ring-hydroxylating ferredoxin subunit
LTDADLTKHGNSFIADPDGSSYHPWDAEGNSLKTEESLAGPWRGLGRRRWIVAAALLVAALALWRRAARAPRHTWRAIGPVPPSDGWYPHADGIWLIREQGRLAVLERRCPHQGCLIYERDDDLWCPCHGSTFQRDGQRMVGPSPRSLAWFAVRQRDGSVEWTPDQSSAQALWASL